MNNLIVSNLVDKVVASRQEDDAHDRSLIGQWYFVTVEEWRELAKSNLGPVNNLFGYELFITLDSEKVGRQFDAHEIVSVIDTYPSYPRVLPR